MACGYAKWTGRLGVCLATSGPGGIHLLNGLYDAKLDGQPVLAITGLQYHDLVNTYTQQDVELDKLFMDVCVYNNRIMSPTHVENVTELACRMALAYRGVSHITMPVDLQSLPVKSAARSKRNVPSHVSNLMAESAHAPTEDQLARAAAILNEGEKICILAGRGALGAREELTAVAERLGAPVAKALLGKAVVARRQPLHDRRHRAPRHGPIAGGARGLRHAPHRRLELSLHRVLSRSPGRRAWCRSTSTRSASACAIRSRLRSSATPPRVLRALLPRLQHHSDRSFLEEAQAGMAKWRELMAERGTRTDMPMKPQVVAHELNRLLADDAIIASDSGTITAWAARHLDIRGGMMFSVSGTLATMACAVPYALAAAIAHPGPAGHCLRRRRRLLDASGRACDRREIRPRRQDRGHPQQHARPDQVGADGVSGQPRVRLRPAADRLRDGRAGASASRASRSRSRRPAARSCGRPSRRRDRWSSTPSSTRTSRRCRRSSASTRPRNLPSRSPREPPTA